MDAKKVLVSVFVVLLLFVLAAFILLRMGLATPVLLSKIAIFLLIVIALGVFVYGQRFRK